MQFEDKKIKKSQLWQLRHIFVFWLYQELQWSDQGDLGTILKLRDISTFGMKTSKSNSAVFLVKRSKHRNLSGWSKAEAQNWPVYGILTISPSTDLQIRWFLKHWNSNSKGYNFCVLHKSQFGLHHGEKCSWSEVKSKNVSGSRISVICSAIFLIFTLLSS